jgi:hypothetical protein
MLHQPVLPGPDQRARVAIPTPAQVAVIRTQLNAIAGDWDGGAAASAADPNLAQRRRGELSIALKAAMADFIEANTGLARTPQREFDQFPRVPIGDFVGAGDAAKAAVDARFGEWTAAAAMTRQRRERALTAALGSRLYDVMDPGQRAAARNPVDPQVMARRILLADPPAQTIAAQHNFDPLRSPEERTFADRVVSGFAEQRGDDLWRIYRYYADLGDWRTGKIGLSGFVLDPSAGADEQRALTIWRKLPVIVHEYLHTLEHPVSVAAGRGNLVLQEGVCEMFAQDVARDLLNGAAANANLVRQVEGRFPSVLSPADIETYDALPMYEVLRRRAAAIRQQVGENALRAAYFQGHVEFLGLAADGSWAPPVGDGVTVPTGIGTLDDLARAARCDKAAILAANAAALGGAGRVLARMVLPGCREHRVVAYREGPDPAVEGIDEIARQHGLASRADLLRDANPQVTWSALPAGGTVLVPVH